MRARRRFGMMVLGVVLTLHAPGRARAGFITTRAALDALLGGAAVKENLETYNVGAGTFSNLNVLTLDSTTVANGQGPHLVVAGFSVTDPTQIQWNGNGYLGLSTKTLFGSDGLAINFTGAPTAFGVDQETFNGFPLTFTATIFAPDDTSVLATIPVVSVPASSPVFLGYTDPGGIGKVLFTNSDQGFSPVIDNLEFGTPAASGVPEPAALTLLATGALGLLGYAWRKRTGVRAA